MNILFSIILNIGFVFRCLIITIYQTKKVISKRRKCFKTRSMLDFSTEHKFKLGREALDDFCIKIQIKSSTTFLKKSMRICCALKLFYTFLSRPSLGWLNTWSFRIGKERFEVEGNDGTAWGKDLFLAFTGL